MKDKYVTWRNTSRVLLSQLEDADAGEELEKVLHERIVELTNEIERRDPSGGWE